MANGKIRFGKQSGGQLALVIPDGVADTEVTFPESGVLATKQYVDSTKAPLNSPALSGTPTAPTAVAGANTTQVATTAFVMNVISAPFVFTAGSRLEAFASGATSYASTYTKICEIQVAGTGVVTTSMVVASAAGSSTAYGRIYKNGIAVGTARSVATGSATFTENINVADGDLIQAYGYGTNINTDNIFNISSLKIYVAKATSSNPTTNS